MSNWSDLRLSNLFPPPAQAAVSLVNTVSDALGTALAVTRVALNVARATAQAAATNPVEAALHATLRELQSVINGLLANTAAHAILIPIQKQPFGRGVRPELSIIPSTDQPFTFENLVDEGAFPGRQILPGTISFIDRSATAVGGNQGFWRTFALSLQDEGDFNRPLFPSNFAVTGVCVLVGANSLQELEGRIGLLKSIFAVNARTDPMARTQPFVLGLKAHVIPDIGSVPARLAVRLQWHSVPPVVTAAMFSGERRIIKEVFVVRSTDKKLRELSDWSQIFSREPQDSRSDLQEQGPHKVIARIVNDGFVNSYVDIDPSLHKRTPYYYSLCLRYTINGKVQPMGTMSAVQRIVLLDPQATVRSEAPDWWASPTLVKIIPSLHTVLQKLEIFLSNIESRTVSNSGAVSMITQTISQIDLIANRAEQANAEIRAATDRLKELLSQGTGGLFSTSFSVNRGGTAAWAGELARRLSDAEDPSRPPFDRGDEFVSGLVIVAGAPTPPALEPLRALLNMLFGSTTENPLLEAIASVDTETRAAEDAVFGDDLQAGTPTEVPEPKKGFDDGLNPTDEVVC
jgi:hypothetical protein